eukprot:5893402-Amphidinium_carterae.1
MSASSAKLSGGPGRCLRRSGGRPLVRRRLWICNRTRRCSGSGTPTSKSGRRGRARTGYI